jgi:hypothetical protein
VAVTTTWIESRSKSLGQGKEVGEDAGTGPSLMRMQEAGAVLWVQWGRSLRREEEVHGPPPGRSGELVGAGCRGGRRPHWRTAGDARRAQEGCMGEEGRPRSFPAGADGGGSPALERRRLQCGNPSSGTVWKGTSAAVRERRRMRLGVPIHGRSSGNCSGRVSRYVKKLGFTVGGSWVEAGLIFWASAVWDLETGVEAQKKSA